MKADPHAGLAHWLNQGAGWLMIGTTVLSPWLYGGTRDWTLWAIGESAWAAGGMWLLANLLRRRLPKIPLAVALATLALVLQAGVMNANPISQYDFSIRRFFPLPHSDAFPGTVDAVVGRPYSMALTGALVMALLACDYLRDSAWRRRLTVSFCLGMAAFSLVGLYFKIGGPDAMAIMWEADRRVPDTSFATFRYRGNAAAFQVVGFAVTLAWVWRAFSPRGGPLERAVAAICLCLTILGIAVNNSRAGWLMALWVLCVGSGWSFWRTFRGGQWLPDKRRLIGGIAFTVAVVGAAFYLFYSGGWKTAGHRFQAKGADITSRNPVPILNSMLPDVGRWGFGPGTFQSAFAPYQAYHPQAAEYNLFWRHAHLDYMQGIIEWGWVGTAMWAVLLGATLLACARAMLQADQAGRSSAACLAAHLAAAFMALLMQAWIDFPFQIASVQISAAVCAGMLWGRFIVSDRRSHHHEKQKSEAG